MEAYHAVHRFMVHIGATPERIQEPTDGVVELLGGGYLARVRIDENPVTQTAVIALLRALEGYPDLEALLFCPMGFSEGAVAFANSRKIALFDLTIEGEVIGVSVRARAMMPSEPLGPAFHDFMFEDDEQEGVSAGHPEETHTPPEDDPWLACPNCGTENHRKARYCASCGVDMDARVVLAPVQPGPKPRPGQVVATTQATPVSRPTATGPTLRCRTCGSHDIELVPAP
ncbi:MAG TPA: zinc ribbon domain-containing protein [Acidimicrobiia bacterium]|jgi:ribosomal protein L37E